ncbi:MAG: response regulator transcription factor [Lachnospiraceae bacterium]|nr:response regulator transcription factor [Lachnospiraceae bacterium]
MNIALCDDDSIAIEYLSSLCREISLTSTITPYNSPINLLTDIQAGSVFDVIIMDIDFETEKNGIDYSEEIYRLAPSVRTIYITGHTDRYIQNIFLQQSSLIGFIIKPAQKDILENLLKKAQQELDKDKQNFICNLGKGNLETIPVSKILFLESNGHNVLIYTEDSSEAYSVYGRLSSLEKQLPSSFRPCHKSYLINMDKIKRIEKREVILINGTAIQISKSYGTKIKEDYIRYMQKNL